MSRSLRGAALTVAALLFVAPVARAQDATVTIYLKNAGTGTFDKTGTIGTEVHVYLTSTVAARWNGSAVLYAPPSPLVAAPGATFTAVIPNLYSPSKVPGNKYVVSLDWPDGPHQSFSYPSFAVQAGQNHYGKTGAGSTAPIEVVNLPPPASSNIVCYPDVPDMTTNLYVYWTEPTIYEDFDSVELHLSTQLGFTPSPATRVASLGYGTSDRKIGGLKPGTGYYFCVRMLDRYGAFTDTCTSTPCNTKPGMTNPDLAVTTDLAMRAADLSGMAAMDLAPPPSDLAMGGRADLAVGATDLSTGGGAMDLSAGSTDLASGGGMGDQTLTGGGDLVASGGANDGTLMSSPDLGGAIGADDSGTLASDLTATAGDEGGAPNGDGAAASDDSGTPAGDGSGDGDGGMSANGDGGGGLPGDDGGSVATNGDGGAGAGDGGAGDGGYGTPIGGCGCTLGGASPTPLSLLPAIVFALLAFRRRPSKALKRRTEDLTI